MRLALVLFAGCAFVEVAWYSVRPFWAIRKLATALLVGVTAFAGTALFALRPNIVSGLLLVICLYRIFNDLRVIEGRMHERFLRRATRQTSWCLVAWQGGLAATWYLWQHFQLSTTHLWALLAGLQLVGALILLSSTVRRLGKTAVPARGIKAYSDAQLPSITVAIPARNETDDLEACLRSIIASDYPKLEVIVLDDCSQTARTPEIIRGFAHDGVRFVQGEEPSNTWLPKNQAYHRLLGEASGEYVLFCGVDVRLAPNTIRALMATMLHRRKLMLSLVPLRSGSAGGRWAPVQAMRYWWELAPPRRLFARPPVLSMCWMASKSALKKLGGFEATRRSIVPEAYFAKGFIRQDGYSFLRSDQALGVFTVKQARDQRETAVRTRYPQQHRRPEAVLMTALAELTFLLLPFVLAVGGFWWHIGLAAQLLAVASSVLLVAAYVCIAIATRLNSWWIALLNFPLVVLLDLGLLHYSMWKYEFSEVLWKARNICIPAMHVIPHLPKLG